MRAILVGAGGIGRSVLERLGEHWDITAVDVDQERLAELAAGRPIHTSVGEGSSRITLERAGLGEVDAVVVALRDDEIALEVCRLAIAAKAPRVVAMVVSSSRLVEFKRLGVVTVSPDRLAAREVELALEPRRVASATFADGLAEAIEFRIAPDSRLIGRTLAEIGMQGWLIVSVLRGSEMIVPHGVTELHAGDRVTVVGPSADHAAMVRTFTEGEAHFPLAFGRRIGVVLSGADDAVLEEAVGFVRLTAAEELVVVHTRLNVLDDEARDQLVEKIEELRSSGPRVEFVEGVGERATTRDLLELHAQQRLGCLVLPRTSGYWRTRSIMRMVRSVRAPVLLASGTPRYSGIVIPARNTAGGWDAGWTGLDLAASNSLQIMAVGASSPRFLVSEDDEPEFRSAVERLRDEGSIRGVDVAWHIERTNPVRLLSTIKADRLLILGVSAPGGLLRPSITEMVASRIRGSMLIVPPPGSEG